MLLQLRTQVAHIPLATLLTHVVLVALRVGGVAESDVWSGLYLASLTSLSVGTDVRFSRLKDLAQVMFSSLQATAVHAMPYKTYPSKPGQEQKMNKKAGRRPPW